jgi:hypothetical protein
MECNRRELADDRGHHGLIVLEGESAIRNAEGPRMIQGREPGDSETPRTELDFLDRDRRTTMDCGDCNALRRQLCRLIVIEGGRGESEKPSPARWRTLRR